MKKIINGKVYDIDTAKRLGGDGGGDGFYMWSEELYQKRTGEFFLYGEGGPATKYAYSIGQNQWSGGTKIIPLAPDAAREWVEKHLDAHDYEQIFGLPDDDAEPVALHMMLPAQLAAAARQRAAEDQVALTTVVERALTDYLNTGSPQATDSKFWFVVDDCMNKGAFREEEKLNVKTKAEAIAKGKRMWNQLSRHDQAERDAFYVCLAEVDDDDCIIYETATEMYTIK